MLESGLPNLALLNLSVAYALVTPLCAHQQAWPLHAVTGASLAVSAIVTARLALMPRRDFLDELGLLSGVLLTLVIAAQWVPVWMLAPCVS